MISPFEHAQQPPKYRLALALRFPFLLLYSPPPSRTLQRVGTWLSSLLHSPHIAPHQQQRHPFPFPRWPLAMHLAIIALLSTASSVAALGPPHGLASRLVKTHSSLARDIKTSLKRAASPAFADKRLFKKKRAATATKKMCRVINTFGASIESSTSPARHPPTTGATTATTTTGTSSTRASQPTSTKVPTANSPWKLVVTNVSPFHAAGPGPSLTSANLLARQ